MDRSEIERCLNQLVNKERESVTIPKEDFMLFRELWSIHPKRNQIIGEAKNGGEIIYKYVEIQEPEVNI